MQDNDVLTQVQAIASTIEAIEPMASLTIAIENAAQLAIKHTQHKKIIVLVDKQTADCAILRLIDINVEYIVADDVALLCETIAKSEERIAAIIISCKNSTPYYYKKVRELCSAEGALMIWENISISSHHKNFTISKYSQPDIICFDFENNEFCAWIGTRKDVVEFQSSDKEIGTRVLPNGMFIFHLNDYETEYLYHEIFVDQAYLQYGINIKEHAIVFDVGANIGLFSLFVKGKSPGAKIYAFEPSPVTFSVLNANFQKLDNACKAFNIGLSDTNQTQEFYYYPGYSVISGFHADQERDATVIVNGTLASIGEHLSAEKITSIESSVRERLSKKIAYQCQMATISEVISQEQIEVIDLLKIDVEGSEYEVLSGISDSDWNKIEQIVMEVHYSDELNVIEGMLENKGFLVHINEDKNLKQSGIHNLFAIRNGK